MLVLGTMMLIPAAVLYYEKQIPDYVFIKSALISIFFGGALFLANYDKIQKISVLQGYLITIFSWFITPLICALPFWDNGNINSLHDAVFEATAGITTTGATILTDVESQPKSILLWRAMLNGLGGIGIIIFAVALSPFLGTGGMQLFNKENSDTEEKFLPKIRYIANDIILTYVLLTICCTILLKFLGMDWFEASTWAMSALSTGGFSIKNNSIAFYNNGWIELVIAVFMLLGALPITYFILALKHRNSSALFGNAQVNRFLKLISIYTITLTLIYSFEHHTTLFSSFRIIAFNLIAAITTAGIYSSNYLTWGTWAPIVFLILFLHGGCTGSTTGSIKIFRWQVVFAFLKMHISKALSPNQVTLMKTGDKVIDNNIVSSVFALIMAFILAITFFTLVLSFAGLDFMTAFGAVIANITGIGTGLSENIGPAGNFASLSPFCKYILSFVMVLGRLEVITIVILLGKISCR